MKNKNKKKGVNFPHTAVGWSLFHHQHCFSQPLGLWNAGCFKLMTWPGSWLQPRRCRLRACSSGQTGPQISLPGVYTAANRQWIWWRDHRNMQSENTPRSGHHCLLANRLWHFFVCYCAAEKAVCVHVYACVHSTACSSIPSMSNQAIRRNTAGHLGIWQNWHRLT